MAVKIRLARFGAKKQPHFRLVVADARFGGLSLVDQHRLVYDALSEPLADGTIHELRIKTKGTA